MPTQKQRVSLLDVDITIDGEIVGGAESLTVDVKRTTNAIWEGGNYKAVEIMEEKEEITGTLEQAWIDWTLVKKLYPDQVNLPYFFLYARVKNKTPGRGIILKDCKIDSWNINSLSIGGGYGKSSLPFKALDWEVED